MNSSHNPLVKRCGLLASQHVDIQERKFMMELQAVGSLLRVERRRAIHSKKKSVSEMGILFAFTAE
jgi:hypothetical protein